MADAPEPTPQRLPRTAVYDAIRDAVAVAWRPRAAWIAGLMVPVFGYSPEIRSDRVSVGDGQGALSPFDGLDFNLGEGTLQISVVAAGLALLWMRLQAQVTAGLLLEADRKTGHLDSDPRPAGADDEPSLGTIWRRGEPVAMDCFGVLASRYVLGILALTVFLVMPSAAAVQASSWAPGLEPLVWMAFGAIALTVFLYLAVIEVATQIALMSCVHNGRGPVSALQHAWRLMRADPAAATRAGLGHFALLVAVVLLQGVVGGVLGGLGTILAVALAGAGGVARVAYWERIFDALGGWRTATPPPVKTDAESKSSGDPPSDSSAPEGAGKTAAAAS